jgi:hypothetical protein
LDAGAGTVSSDDQRSEARRDEGVVVGYYSAR